MFDIFSKYKKYPLTSFLFTNNLTISLLNYLVPAPLAFVISFDDNNANNEVRRPPPGRLRVQTY